MKVEANAKNCARGYGNNYTPVCRGNMQKRNNQCIMRLIPLLVIPGGEFRGRPSKKVTGNG